MPVHKCQNGKWRIGRGPCVYDTLDSAERAYAGYLAATHSEKVVKTYLVLKAVGQAIYEYQKAASRPRALNRLKVQLRTHRPVMLRAFKGWMRRVRSMVMAKRPTTPDAVDRINWDKVEEEGKKAIGPVMERTFRVGYAGITKDTRTDAIGRAAKKYVDTSGAKNIKEITEQTRAAVKSLVKEGIDNNWSPQKMAGMLESTVGMNEAGAKAVANRYDEVLREANDERAALAASREYASRLVEARAMMIARTEVNNALRSGIVDTMKDSAIVNVIWVADPEACEVCAGYDGNTYTIEEYEDIMNPHPNCECTVVIGEREAEAEEEPSAEEEPERVAPEEEAVEEISQEAFDQLEMEVATSEDLDLFQSYASRWTSGIDTEARDLAYQVAMDNAPLKSYLQHQEFGLKMPKKVTLYRTGSVSEDGVSSFWTNRSAAEAYARRMGVETIQEYVASSADVVPSMSGAGEVWAKNVVRL